MTDLSALHAPFPPNEIKWRIGSTNGDKTSGLALAYLTSRHIMDRLDTVVGPENWQDRYEIHGSRCICYLSIRINDEWVTKADGAGDTQVEAEKGGISDALKRAAVKWGIGRYLYGLGNVWVQCEQRGRTTIIKQGQEGKLEAALNALSGSVKQEKPASTPFDSVEQSKTFDALTPVEREWLENRMPGIRFADDDSRRQLSLLQESLDLAETKQDFEQFIAENRENIGFLIDPHYLTFKHCAAAWLAALSKKARAHG